MDAKGPISALVIDDSAHSRRLLVQLLESAGDIRVLDRAGDGEDGLQKALRLRPEVITLDLEMPGMDGFSFLRLLMATAPTPVIVVSTYAHKADVFRALDLGALDFVAKPGRGGRVQMEEVRSELLEKVRAVRLLRRSTPRAKPAPAGKHLSPLVVGIGASTGGPPAIQRILESLSADSPLCLLVCQHMPPRFTQAFAERLDRMGPLVVREAQDGDEVQAGRAFIAPGGRHLVLERRDGRLSLRTPAPLAGERHAPSVDRLFASMAEQLGARSLGVVLTGMGADGRAGAAAIGRAGGEVWAESEETAVIDGMPKEAIASGAVTRVLPLPEIGPALGAAAAAAARRRRG